MRQATGLFAFAVLAYAATPADAQTSKSSTKPADAQVGFQRRVQLSPAEQIAESETLISRMEGTATTLRHQLEAARASRDVVKTLCLNDKLSQVDVAVRSAKDRKSALQAAASRNDSETTNHEFTILTVLRQRSEQLTAEANQCIGEEAAYLGDTSTSVSIDPTIPGGDDTTLVPTDPSLISAPAACTSCTQ